MLKEIDNGKNKIKTTKKTKKALEKIYYEKKRKCPFRRLYRKWEKLLFIIVS